MSNRKIRKAGVGVTLAASVAAAFGGLLAASPAEAACASFWGMGTGGANCVSTVGNIAVALDDTSTAVATGGFGNTALSGGGATNATAVGYFNTAIALGEKSTATAVGVANTSLSLGKNTQSLTTGVLNTAADIGDNTAYGSGRAVAVGLGNRAVNVGGDNFATAISGFPPVVNFDDPAHPVIDVGFNSVTNIGKGNWGLAQDGFANGVTQIGDRNMGFATGVLSNVIQIGNDNYGIEKVKVLNPDWHPYESLTESHSYVPKYIYIDVPKPNVAAGLGAENLVIGNNNEANSFGNLNLVNTFGNDNKHNVTGASQLPGGKPFDLDLNLSTVFGNGNKQTVEGKNNITTTVGNENRVQVKGNTNLTSVFGNGNKIAPGHTWAEKHNGVTGNNNITTVAGNDNEVKVKGNTNLTSIFGHRDRVHVNGDNQVATAVGDDKHVDKPDTP